MTPNPPMVTACDGCQRAESAEQEARDAIARHVECYEALVQMTAERDSLKRQIELHAGDLASEASARAAAEERAEEAEAEAEVLRRRFESRTRVARRLFRACMQRATERDSLRAQLATAREEVRALRVEYVQAGKDSERLVKAAREEGRREGMEIVRDLLRNDYPDAVAALGRQGWWMRALAEKGGGR